MREGSAAAVDAVETARTEFRCARFAAAADLLHQHLVSNPHNAEAALLLARVELRRGAPESALAVLARHAKRAQRVLKAEAALLKGVAFARLGDAESSSAQFNATQSLLRADDTLSAELTYQLAANEWMERRLDRAEKILGKVPQNFSPDLALHVAILRGAIASANEKLPAQGAILLAALQHIGRAADVEVYLYAMLVTYIAALAVELPSQELRDAAAEHISRVPWTEDIADLHFHAVRAIAWRHALDGDEFNAFRRLKEALAVANSPAWRVAALTDRAYLASALGEKRWSAQELRDAHELASTIDWSGITGEEKLALPVLAELYAQRDPAVALTYVATFKSVHDNFPRILSSRRDRRVEALEAYSLGKVQFELDDRSEAERLLKNAWHIYDRLGIGWRSARAALALAEISDAETWRERAANALEHYPRSWLARGLGAPVPRTSIAESAAAEALTPAQRAVLELLLEGRGTEEIASMLDRSTFTVRNHLKAIFKAFAVTSRAALIVKAAHGG